MPTSMPDSMIASRSRLLAVRTSSERVVRPSASVKVTTFRAGSPSGAPGSSKISVLTIRWSGTISRTGG
jgi:hypothetical protein